jgi:Uma2 family endonuclease
LKVDPPPDLAVEVDISHGSRSKFRIYARLKVKELWRFDGKKVTTPPAGSRRLR